MGVRGVAAGAVVGTGLGLVAGCASVGLIKLSGTSMEEARYWQYKWKTDRIGAYREGYEKNLKLTPFYHKDAHQDAHDERIGENVIDLKDLSDEVEKKDEKKPAISVDEKKVVEKSDDKK